MGENLSPPPKKLPIIHLLPNLMTLGAIAAGLSAIQFGFYADFKHAVQLILLACVLDGLDGMTARHLKCSSQTGAELDSLADFVNFGVAPALVVYAWALQDMPRIGWIAVLVYALCCVLRLARFNVAAKATDGDTTTDHFIGVPSPAGAILVMFPMFVSFLISDAPIIPPLAMALYMAFIGVLMISRLPTPSIKKLEIPTGQIRLFLLAAFLIAAALLTYLWATMTLLCIGYCGLLLTRLATSRTSKQP